MRVAYTTGILQFIVCVFIPHIFVVSISSSSYLKRFSAVFSEVFLSDNTAISMSLQVFSLWSLFSILAIISLSSCSCFCSCCCSCSCSCSSCYSYCYMELSE